MGPALRILGPSVMPLVCPLRVPYVSLTCPLRVPSVSLTCPLRVPYVSLTWVTSYVGRMSRYMSHYFYVSQIRRDIRSAPLCRAGCVST